MITKNARGNIIYTPELVETLRKITENLPRAEGVKMVGKYLKVKDRQARETYAKYVNAATTTVPPAITKKESGDNLETEYKTTEVTRVEDVIKACNVDQKTWRVKSFAVSQNRAGAFVWRTSFERDKAAINEHVVSELQTAIAAVKPDWSGVKEAKKSSNSLYIIQMPDLHIGKLADGDETGWGDYDSKMAAQLARDAAKGLMQRLEGKPVQRILFPVGNDLIHVDRADNTTTAGTRQDADTRSYKMFVTAASVVTEIVTELAKTYKVDVIMVRGNHDTDTIFHLGEVVRAYFNAHKNVTVDNSPTQRKYYRFDKNLFMFTHGNDEKQSDLPLIMAQERRQDWGETKWRSVFLGHLHHEKVRDYQGVRVHVLPSLSGNDAWHAGKGYVGSVRAAMGMLFDGEDGLLTQHYFYPSEVA
jgi:predicted phosphodiesterase